VFFFSFVVCQFWRKGVGWFLSFSRSRFLRGKEEAGMEYRYLGRSGLKVSRLSYGSWVTFKNQVDVELGYELMKVAYKAGVNFFDNAETYANGDSERLMGLGIKKGIEDKVWDRSDLVVSTKLFFGYKARLNNVGLSRKHIIEGCNDALDRMGLDYVDLVFAHR